MTKIEARFKLSQNRSAEERLEVIEALKTSTDPISHEVSPLMENNAQPSPILEQGEIQYYRERMLDIEAISVLYERAGLNRPTRDLLRLKKMYMNSNLVVSAWRQEELVGVARSLTDFSYCCYLSDLAVMPAFQKHGIGKTLLDLTKRIAGPQSMLLLLSAPNAMEYYPRVGFEAVQNGFIIKRKEM